MIELYGVVREESIDNKQGSLYVSIIYKDFSSALLGVKTRGNGDDLVIILFRIRGTGDTYSPLVHCSGFISKYDILKFYYKKDYESYLTLW